MIRRTPLLLLLALSPACGQQELEVAPPTPPVDAAKEAKPLTEVSQHINPLTGQPVTQARIKELPNDKFFQEYAYPGAEVLDVKEVFGTPTVWLHSRDEFAKIDAFYKKKFIKEDGSIEGRPGTYYRMTKQNRMEKASYQTVSGGGCDIVLTM